MFGRSKWRLLTFIIGILLANTIHSLGPNANSLPAAQTSPEIGFVAKLPAQSLVRNLLSPQEIFSTVDHVRFMERRMDTTSGSGAEEQTVAGKNQIGSFRLQQKVENFTSSDDQPMYTVPNVTKVARADFNDDFMYDDSEDDFSVGVIDTRTTRPETPKSLHTQTPTNVAQRPPFIPQGYKEDRFDFDELLLPNQKPFQSEPSEFRREHRIGRTVVFPGEVESSSSQEYNRLKSIINVESSIPVPKSLSALLPNSGLNVAQINVPMNRHAFSQAPAPYFPQKSYELFSDYPGPPKHPIFPQNQNPNQWRSRSPRVIFPEGPPQYSSDNVVFRWVFKFASSHYVRIFDNCRK